MEITIDLHGMDVDEAKYQLIQEINNCDNTIWRIVAIHGYNRGTAIKDMIRYELRHKKIKKINADLNKGITLIELKH